MVPFAVRLCVLPALSFGCCPSYFEQWLARSKSCANCRALDIIEGAAVVCGHKTPLSWSSEWLGGDRSSWGTTPSAIVPAAGREALGWERNPEQIGKVHTTSATDSSSQSSRRTGYGQFLEGPEIPK